MQYKLTKTNIELGKARLRLGFDHPDVQDLVEQVARLRAWGPPNPNEPVYEGRTLPDWLAQMRFEIYDGAKEFAATRVAELSSTRPGSEGLLLALEAGDTLFRICTANPRLQIDGVLFGILSSQSQPFGLVSRAAFDLPIERMATTDRSEADRILADMLAGDETGQRDYAMLLFACMGKLLTDENGGWPTTLQAMNTLVRDKDHLTGVRARTILAACAEDEAEASRYLTEADADDASSMNLLCWFLVTQNRSLPVTRDQQIRWLGEYFTKIPDGDMGCLLAVFTEPTMGPLKGVNWDAVTDDQRDVVSRALEPLIGELREDSKRLDRTPQLESAVSAKSYTLCHVIDYVSLDEPTRAAAIAALNLRLEQLLDLRDRSDASIVECVLDSPSQVAVAITLLSGRAPVAVKRSPNGGPYSAELDRLPDPRTASQGQSRDQNRQFEQLFAWYPYQALKKLAELETSRRSDSSSRSSISYLSMFEKFHRALVHPVLAVDYIADTPETDEEVVKWKTAFSQTMAKPRVLAPYVKRHPKFSERIVAWVEEAGSQEMVKAAAGILRESWTESQYVDWLHDWLADDDLQHISYGVELFRELDLTHFRSELRRDIAQAIAKASSTYGFRHMGVQHLQELGEDAEPAIDQLAHYIETSLQSSDARLYNAYLVEALEVLGRFPDKVKSMRPVIEAELVKQADNEDKTKALTNFLEAIE